MRNRGLSALAQDDRVAAAYNDAIAELHTTDLVVIAMVDDDGIRLQVFDREWWAAELMSTARSEKQRHFVERLDRPATEGADLPLAFWLIGFWSDDSVGICRVQCARANGVQ